MSFSTLSRTDNIRTCRSALQTSTSNPFLCAADFYLRHKSMLTVR